MKTKKVTKREYVVDLTKAETPEDVKFEFIRGKAKAKGLTDEDLKFIALYGSQITLDAIDDALASIPYFDFETNDTKKIQKIVNILVPRKPWYKRFWAWLTKPFKKNK